MPWCCYQVQRQSALFKIYYSRGQTLGHKGTHSNFSLQYWIMPGHDGTQIKHFLSQLSVRIDNGRLLDHLNVAEMCMAPAKHTRKSWFAAMLSLPAWSTQSSSGPHYQDLLESAAMHTSRYPSVIDEEAQRRRNGIRGWSNGVPGVVLHSRKAERALG